MISHLGRISLRSSQVSTTHSFPFVTQLSTFRVSSVFQHTLTIARQSCDKWAHAPSYTQPRSVGVDVASNRITRSRISKVEGDCATARSTKLTALHPRAPGGTRIPRSGTRYADR